MTHDQIRAIRLIAQALLETVQEAGEQGAPAGIMYAALMGKINLEQFQAFMAALVNSGKVRKEGHVYYANK